MVESVQFTSQPGQPGIALPRTRRLHQSGGTQLGKEAYEICDALLCPLSASDQQGIDGDRQKGRDRDVPKQPGPYRGWLGYKEGVGPNRKPGSTRSSLVDSSLMVHEHDQGLK